MPFCLFNCRLTLVTQAQSPQPGTPNDWNPFCDFPEMTHIAITEANVCISTQDNHCMVRLLYFTVKAKNPLGVMKYISLIPFIKLFSF